MVRSRELSAIAVRYGNRAEEDRIDTGKSRREESHPPSLSRQGRRPRESPLHSLMHAMQAGSQTDSAGAGMIGSSCGLDLSVVGRRMRGPALVDASVAERVESWRGP
jgi:hypothetical protein